MYLGPRHSARQDSPSFISLPAGGPAAAAPVRTVPSGAGAGSSAAAPVRSQAPAGALSSVFGGMYDPHTAPSPVTPPGPPVHTALLTGITDSQTSAQQAAGTLNHNTNAYAAYDGNNASPSHNPTDAGQDMAMDALAVLQYAQAGNTYHVGPDGNIHGNPTAANQGVGGLFGSGEQYVSPTQVGQGGTAAALGQGSGGGGSGAHATPAQAGEPIVLDAHSGGGQSAFFTAAQLHNQGYTNVTVVGYDMAMTPQERATLAQTGVNVTNTTSHIGSDQNYINSPVGAIIQMAMGGGPGYYDNNIRADPSVTSSAGGGQPGLQELATNWHGFQNPTSSAYIQGQNQQAAQGTLTNPTVDRSNDIYVPVGEILAHNVPILHNFYANIHPNVAAQSNLDLSQGAASTSLNLSGTTIDTPFTHNTIGDWAQASGGVNLHQGAANFNVGGQNGIGADVNLSRGQIDLNAFGHKIDVDQGIRTVANTAGNVAHNVGQGISNVAHNVVNTAGNVAHNIGQGVSNVAHNVVNTAGNVAHNVGQGISNVAHSVVNTAGDVVGSVVRR